MSGLFGWHPESGPLGYEEHIGDKILDHFSPGQSLRGMWNHNSQTRYSDPWPLMPCTWMDKTLNEAAW